MDKNDFHLLLVEDDAIDAEAMRRALARVDLPYPLTWIADSEEALARLEGEREPAIPRPVVVLLDLNMPRLHGLEFLERLRTCEVLKDLRVFILTTSDDEMDRRVANRFGVDGYILKDRSGSGFRELAGRLAGLRGSDGRESASV